MYFSIASVSAILLASLVNAAPMAGPGAGLHAREPEAMPAPLPVPAMHHAAAPVEKRAEDAVAEPAVEAEAAAVEAPTTEEVADYRYQTNYRYSGI